MHAIQRKTAGVVGALLVAALLLCAAPVFAADGTADALPDADQGLVEADLVAEEDLTLPQPVALLAANGDRAEQPALSGREPLRIAIDPGHGGHDPGAVAGGLEEKTLNLKIATYLRDILNTYYGVETYMTRSNDTFVSLSDRTANAAAWGADAFVSVHINETPGATGVLAIVPNDSTYRAQLRDRSRALASSILTCLSSQTGLRSRGFLIRNGDYAYPDGSTTDWYSITYGCRVWGMVGTLVEHGFIDGAALDVSLLSNEAGLRRMAQADADGIVSYYGLKKTGAARAWVDAIAPGRAVLRWQPVRGATEYAVRQLAADGSTWTTLAEGVSGTSFTVDGLADGQSYTFVVLPKLSGVWSGFDADDHVRLDLVSAPAAHVEEVGYSYVTLAWEPVPGATRYEVAQKLESGAYRTFTQDCTDTSFTVGDFPDGRTRSFLVRAQVGGRWTPLDQTYLLSAAPLHDPVAADWFSDVGYDSWYNAPITRAVELDYMHGHANSPRFGPKESLTRGQAAVVLWNMSGGAYGDADPADAGFSDVPAGAYYAAAVAWAHQAGVVNGHAGRFRPNDPVTRQEFAAMLANYAALSGDYEAGHEGALDAMSDPQSVSGWARASVGWAVARGVMGNAGYVAGKSAVTRAEAATMAVNYQPEPAPPSQEM